MTTRDTGSPCSDEKSIGFWNARKQVLLRGVTWNDVPESLDSPMVQSLVGRCLLVECLRRQGLFTGWPVYRYGPFGKPQLENYPGLFFNISHCCRAVVCVVADHEIGVDVETITEIDKQVMDLVLNDREIDFVVSHTDPPRAFTQRWTQKESLLKCLGTGICENIKDILDCYDCEFWPRHGDDYEISVCLRAVPLGKHNGLD